MTVIEKETMTAICRMARSLEDICKEMEKQTAELKQQTELMVKILEKDGKDGYYV